MKRRILVIEDQEDNRRILRDLLTAAGYEVIEAENGGDQRDDEEDYRVVKHNVVWVRVRKLVVRGSHGSRVRDPQVHRSVSVFGR